ncbi:aspartyl/asparaginyl beta-hydroxylase domain-containing protein [Dokdonella sp.]|uniref:aspartyl/asparaginyl beta-hydroxylase domain-containing protein n=1 Tax=Dokdonella sp. TaxID=2291710 RepID=UPI0027B9C1A9|nr:aspartyl/asparaginyl beta-hydroxylase domain-containing protein [Dokdonella sp.]
MPYVRIVLLALFVVYLASVWYVHRRGRVRLPLKRQLFDHSGLFAPCNVALYLSSALPARPYPPRRSFGCVDPLRDNWQMIRDEALRLFDEGYIRSAEQHNDASFASFFKTGWKRFYLKWYDAPLKSARALCPHTVALVESIPQVRAAMFAVLPPGARLNPHRDPFAGSIRYHLGLATPNSDECRIVVDGEPYAWRDGEDVLFDETYVHCAENNTGQSRLILFCDVERPLRGRVMPALNHALGSVLGRATATQNIGGEPVGVVNRLYGLAHRAGRLRKRFKLRAPLAYHVLRVVLVLALVAWLLSPWLPAMP